VERTVFNDIVVVTADFPVDQSPWTNGQVVATVPVNNLDQVFVSVTSHDPTLGQLGKSRMAVYWLDANDQIGGILASDDGTAPATLWPYCENHFWTATHTGSTGWQGATALQIVMFRHHETPGQLCEWLVSVIARERVPQAAYDVTTFPDPATDPTDSWPVYAP
jgi:hypothetical protein